MANVELLNNAQFAAFIGSGNTSHRCTDLITGITFNLSFSGARTDHYDVTPTTEHDADEMVRSIGGIGNMGTQGWIARPVAITNGNRRAAAGLNTFMHHIRIGRSNPGARFPSLNESGPPWTRWGGHCCLYVSNSTGGASNENATNPHARPLANERANTPRARGRRARAACHEAHLRGLNTGSQQQNSQNVSENILTSATIDLIASEVMLGRWGNGQERIDRLRAAGHNPDVIQARVRELSGQPAAPALLPLDDIAREVMLGRWGNGQERIDRLRAAGYNADKVQARVRELLGQ